MRLSREDEVLPSLSVGEFSFAWLKAVTFKIVGGLLSGKRVVGAMVGIAVGLLVGAFVGSLVGVREG